ncbi:MAG: hypothetical protein M0Q41_07315 [Bacteroidales bacterium]|nr:hypothetical protein [Bacteroidales bacterium]
MRTPQLGANNSRYFTFQLFPAGHSGRYRPTVQKNGKTDKIPKHIDPPEDRNQFILLIQFTGGWINRSILTPSCKKEKNMDITVQFVPPISVQTVPLFTVRFVPL